MQQDIHTALQAQVASCVTGKEILDLGFCVVQSSPCL